jgi:hypothetical protein
MLTVPVICVRCKAGRPQIPWLHGPLVRKPLNIARHTLDLIISACGLALTGSIHFLHIFTLLLCFWYLHLPVGLWVLFQNLSFACVCLRFPRCWFESIRCSNAFCTRETINQSWRLQILLEIAVCNDIQLLVKINLRLQEHGGHPHSL